MAAESTRQKKVARMIQRELSQVLERELGQMYELAGNPMVTLTHINVTADLQIARAYITVFPDEKLPVVLKYLEEQQGEVRHKLARRIRNSFKFMPALEFYEDDTMKIANRIDELLADALPPEPEDADESDARPDGEADQRDEPGSGA